MNPSRLIAAPVLLTLLAAALPAAAAERRFPNTGFTQIVVEASDDVAIRTGPFAITASGPAAELERLELRQDGAVLRIGRKKGNWRWTSEDVKFAVQLPALAGVTISGSADVTADRASGPAAALRISGSGDLSVQQVSGNALSAAISGSGNLAVGAVAVQSMSIALSGSGDATFAGRCAGLDVRVSGSGDVDAARLACATASIAISGSGDVQANAAQTATVRTTGSGDVTVRGGARCTSRASGSGVISCG
jgi:Putative auto-transporter adhesin, head GIN domain